jgi:MFS family permease
VVGLGTSIGQVAIAWITLELTSSPLGVAATLAARLAPSLILGIPLGSLADRVDRRRLLIWADVAGALASGFVAVLAVGGGLDFLLILSLSFVIGCIDTVRTTATQAYVYDLVGSSLATSGIALSNLGSQLSSAIGAIAGGVVVATGGTGPAFILAALASFGGAALLIGSSAARSTVAIQPSVNLRRTVTLLMRSHNVAAIAMLVILAEVFGFSGAALVPTFAKEILLVDATGLGILLAAKSLGGVFGLSWLATAGSGFPAGRLILIVTAAFGISLVSFALSRSFAFSMLMIFVAGTVAAPLDTLGQTLLQRTAPDNERGAGMGVWVFSIGFGPIGFLVLGAAAAVVGVSLIQAISGLVLVAVAMVMARTTGLPDLR